ncbi:MAG TPA: lipopolysaccharide assembly protein LapA domain-containing protein [Gammaproteobacteria bacterium]|nr:DUF1049 domain-containing protein [Xanthomonadales bacterium]MCB1593749.1 DUF1049 domain-containing protein [Xanthomonadales bacterium]HOP22535.1 lipopolysaccharide assembly protein LapA domain-containing protein [Gammaproteobacteria bacterium]HPI95176.1 lipopolysaccharide assembly protein LapA domain-containing protein [Gammaproteobacteria bacterium]HPQ86713.1 lipopolysaccharide assembly protein LapA domain-containing protein [Gammaproteobacteria bacterium]
MLLLKRLVLFVVAVAVIVMAVAVSGLNTEKVTINLYFFQFELTLGFALIIALIGGLLTGLLMSLFQFYMPLKSEIRKLSRKNYQQEKLNLEQKRLEQIDAND